MMAMMEKIGARLNISFRGLNMGLARRPAVCECVTTAVNEEVQNDTTG